MSYCYMVVRCNASNILAFVEAITPLLKQLGISYLYSNEADTPIGYPFIVARLMRENNYRYLRNHPATAAGAIVNDMLVYVVKEKPQSMPHPLVHRVIFKDTFDYLDAEFARLIDDRVGHTHTSEEVFHHHQEFRRLLRASEGFGGRYADQIDDSSLPTMKLTELTELRKGVEALSRNLVTFFTNYAHSGTVGGKVKFKASTVSEGECWEVVDDVAKLRMRLLKKAGLLHVNADGVVEKYPLALSGSATTACLKGPHLSKDKGLEDGVLYVPLSIHVDEVHSKIMEFNTFCDHNHIDLQMCLYSHSLNDLQ